MSPFARCAFIVVSVLTLGACSLGPSAPSTPAPAAAAVAASAAPLNPGVEFKFNPGGSYGGVRWRGAPFSSGLMGGTEATVEARVGGNNPQWTASDPQRVTVAAASGDQLSQVRITVLQPGESTLSVSSSTGSRVLRIRAKQVLKDAMQVQITEVAGL